MNMDINYLINNELEKLAWRAVPNEAIRLAKLASITYSYLKDKKELPRIWYQPDEQILFFDAGPEKSLIKLASYKNILHKAPNVKYLEYDWNKGPPSSDLSYVPFRFYDSRYIFKRAEENPYFKPDAELRNAPPIPNPAPEGVEPVKTLGQITGYTEGPVANILGGPSPLSATIGGGLLGAGLGYGAGTLLEHLFPERYVERGKARRAFGILGGLAGAAPGVWYGAANYRNNLPLFSKASEDLTELLSDETDINNQFKTAIEKLGAEDYSPVIQTDAFNNIIWSSNDPYTSTPLRAAASGLVTGAGAIRQSDWVSPMDIARIAQGGYMGLRFGRAAGALFGLKPQVQDKLMEMGAWTGVLKSTLPGALS